jgi:hypothetical protein
MKMALFGIAAKGIHLLEFGFVALVGVLLIAVSRGDRGHQGDSGKGGNGKGREVSGKVHGKLLVYPSWSCVAITTLVTAGFTV